MKLDFAHAALLEIDIQNDFCPGGALAVDKGDEVIAPLNALARCFAQKDAKVIATQDWHPEGHSSFASAPAQGPWPDHCVGGSFGAAFHEKLDLKPAHLIIRKGFRQNLDSYSAFFENDRETPTGLAGFLAGLSIDTVVLGGLATDYCVLYSALDARRLGLKTIVLLDAVRGVGLPEGSVEKALKQMEEAGVILTESAALT
ncbi:nicotinamidase [Spirochaetia bacterium]|nr:nicotinamidase [Spirochaetia bacterium]